MSDPWAVEFFESEAEGCPVREFLEDLDVRGRAKVVALSQVRGRLRELRTRYGKDHYRLLYFGAPRRTFVLLHAFAKRTPRTPERDIALAERRMAAHLEARGQATKE